MNKVQVTSRSTANGTTSVAITFSTLPTEGNGLVVMVNAFRSTASKPATCVDNRGNPYLLGYEAVLGNAAAVIFYCPLIHTVAAPFTITITSSSGILNWQALAVEVGGLGLHGLVIEGGANAIGNTSSPYTDTMTPLYGTESFQCAIHAIAAAQSSITLTSAPGTWTVEFEELTATQIAGEAITRIVTGSAGTTPSVTWTDSTVFADWAAVLVAFWTHPVLPYKLYPGISFPLSGPSPGATGDLFASYIKGPWTQKNERFDLLMPTKFSGVVPGSLAFQRPKVAQTAPFTRHYVNYVSPPLKAQTLSGTMDLVIGLHQSNADMQYRWRIVVWVSAPWTDGPPPNTNKHFAFASRGVLLDYTEPLGRTMPTSTQGWGLLGPVALATLAIQEGDHLVVEIGVVTETSTSTASPTRTFPIAAAPSSGKPPTGVPNPDLIIGSALTTSRAGYVAFSNPVVVIDPPVNDECATPIVIGSIPYASGPLQTEMATYNAATDALTSCRTGGTDEGLYTTMWWQWTATATGLLRLEGDSEDDTALIVYTGSCGALTEVACKVGYVGGNPTHLLSVTLGTTYRFRMGARSFSDCVTFGLKARWILPVTNDNFADRLVIGALPYTHVSDMTLATVEAGEPVAPSGVTSVPGQSIWYEWTADATPGNIRVDTRGSLTDSQVTVWTRPGGVWTEVFSASGTNTSDDDGFIDQTLFVFTPVPGTTYYITIFCQALTSVGTHGGDMTELILSRVPAVPNQTVATALTVTVPQFVAYDITNAADGPMEVVPSLPSCNYFTREGNDSGKVLWFTWTADRTIPVNINTHGPPITGPWAELILYTGAPGTTNPSLLVPIACDSFNFNSQAQLILNQVVGTTYYLRMTSQARISGLQYLFLDEHFTTFQIGDVVISDTWIWLLAPNGGLRRIGTFGSIIPTGSAYDAATGLLTVAEWAYSEVYRLTGELEIVSTYEVAPGVTPEVPGFFADERLYIGHWGLSATHGIDGITDPPFAIRQFDPNTGALLAVHLAKQENTGTAWLDPHRDQVTLHYTSLGRRIMAYDVEADAQGPDLTLPGAYPTYRARGIRHTATDHFLIADSAEVKRVTATGAVVQTYPLGTPPLDDLNVLDQSPDGTFMWVGDQDSDRAFKVNVATGAYEELAGSPFIVSASNAHHLCGISVIGGFRAGTAPEPAPSLACPLIFPVGSDA